MTLGNDHPCEGLVEHARHGTFILDPPAGASIASAVPATKPPHRPRTDRDGTLRAHSPPLNTRRTT